MNPGRPRTRPVCWFKNKTADNESEEASEDYSDYSSDEWI